VAIHCLEIPSADGNATDFAMSNGGMWPKVKA
jgi:hypothetical protein